MCLIVFAPNLRHALIRKSVLKRGFEGNSHGCGFSYIEDGQLKLEKGFMTFENFMSAYKNLRQRVNSGPLLIHFRYATCGEHNKTNSQPIFVRDNLAMAHNGVFSDLSFPELNISDSVLLARSLGKMNMQFPMNKAYRLILQALCAGYSKLVFMDNTGKWDIINSNLGAWRKGCWYSDKGECLKRELHFGFYKSKKWRNKSKSGGLKKSKKKIDLNEHWCLPPDYHEAIDEADKTIKKIDNDFNLKNAPKPIKQTTVYKDGETFGYKSPFGGPSSMYKPTTFYGNRCE